MNTSLRNLILGAALASASAHATSFLGDFDGDGYRNDVLVQNDISGTIAVVLGFESSSLREVALLRNWKPSWELHPADFNGDGIDDVFAVDLDNGRVKMALTDSLNGYYGSGVDRDYTGSELPDWSDLGLSTATATDSVDLVETWDSNSTSQYGLQYQYIAANFHPSDAGAQIVQYDPAAGSVRIRRNAYTSTSNHIVTEQNLSDGYGYLLVNADLSVVHRASGDLLRTESYDAGTLYFSMDKTGYFIDANPPANAGCDDYFGCDDGDDATCNPAVEDCEDGSGGSVDPTCNAAVEDCDNSNDNGDDYYGEATSLSIGSGGPKCMAAAQTSWFYSALLPLFLGLLGLRRRND